MRITRPGRGAAAADEIILAVPVELKNLVEPIERLIRTAQEARAGARGGAAVDYATVERDIETAAAAIERAAHAGILPALEVDCPRVAIGGKTYVRVVRSSPGTYYTMTGPVTVPRSLYREEGCRNAPTVDAISVRAGVFDGGWLPKTAQAIAHHVQQGPSRDAAESAKQSGRLPYSRASFERVAHTVGEEWSRHHADIEDALAQDLVTVDGVSSISVSLDRVSIPMEEPTARPVGRPRKNAPKRPINRQFRMAYCGTVTLHDENGESLHTIRRGCMPQGDPELLCMMMANDVYRLVEARPGLKIKLLADGSPEMWNLLENAFPPELFGDVHRGIDFWHLIEKLHPAAKVLFGDEQAPAELRRWKSRLLHASRAGAKILDELHGSAREWTWRDSKQPVHEAITYLENHADRLDFATSRRKNLPIGSGNVEATCKTLVEVRMKRAGSRWKEETGEHVLQLRALALSDRFDPAMDAMHDARRTAVRPAA